MPVSVPRSRAVVVLLAVVAGLLLFTSSAMASDGRGVLYTQTNDPNGNTVQQFDRGPGGSLTSAGTFATGGVGLATLGGRQGAVELSGDGRYLYAVNAGSDSVSVFRAGRHRTELVDVVAARGDAPASIAEHDRVVGRRPGRGLLGRRLAERPLRLHGQRGRGHQRLRESPRMGR